MQIVSVVLVLVVAVLTPRVGHACSCSITELILPADGAVDVPLNTAIWVGSGEAPVTLLESGSNALIETECTDFGHTRKCRPLRALREMTSYRISTATSPSFTTGSTVDTDPPAQPSERSRRYYSKNGASPPPFSDSCDSSEPRGVVVLSMNGGDPIIVVDATGSTSPDAPSGPVTELVAVTPVDRGDEVWIGTWICMSNHKAAPGDRFPLRAGSFDIAGNFSGWVELKDAEIPPALLPGCTATPPDGMMPVVMTALGLLRARRRTRHS